MTVVSLASIFGSTFVSEDLACITVGLLIADGAVTASGGLLACALGIYVGDLAVWAMGRAARRGGAMRHLSSRLDPAAVERFGARLDANAGTAIIASRFLPGSRVALYFTAGVLGLRAGRFAGWTLVAVLLWVPLVVFGAAQIGGAGVAAMREAAMVGSWATPVAAVALFGAWRAARRAIGPAARARAVAAASRAWRWEFWPPWVFYAPLVPWIALLALRHGGLRAIAAANPGLPEGGFVGESKASILGLLPARWTPPWVVVPPAAPEARVEHLGRGLLDQLLAFPLVLKPDVGQRGVGVRRVHSMQEAADYLAAVPAAVIAQAWHPGPFEAGIFYVRRPGEARGGILSITDKSFPEVAGDGRSTLRELIWAHPRHRMQARTFLRRHRARLDEVVAAAERVPLGIVGNHAQGAQFRDGSHLWTPALESRIDEIARSVPGFFVGRFDVRYRDLEQFRAGDDLAIVELNGATSESTNLYDPAFSLGRAYGILFRQWRLVFEIGRANLRAGRAGASGARLAQLALEYAVRPVRLPTSD